MEVREQNYIQHSKRVAILENPNDSKEKIGIGKTLKRI
jgi:hypothetical protein